MSKHKRNDVKANVLYDWDETTNPGVKFLPGELVRVHCTKDSGNSDRHLKAKSKTIGRIHAVSCADMENKLIRPSAGSRPCRYWTAYYVEFSDGTIHGYRSQFITSLRAVDPAVTQTY